MEKKIQQWEQKNYIDEETGEVKEVVEVIKEVGRSGFMITYILTLANALDIVGSKKTKILNEGFKTQDYGIASSKSNQELIDYTNDLIAKWQKDVSLQKLYDKYNLKPAKAENK